MEEKYYTLLKEVYGDKKNVVTELINLEAILHLPKGTEHFVSDLHGEFEAFDHVLRNGSGSIKEKLADCFQATDVNIQELATLIYYPEEKLRVELAKRSGVNQEEWFFETIQMLVRMTNFSSQKYTRSKVRKALPSRFQYIIEELLSEAQNEFGREAYFHAIIEKVIELDRKSVV